MPNSLDLTPMAARVGYFDGVCDRIAANDLNVAILDLLLSSLAEI
jgi:hypothetical protein